MKTREYYLIIILVIIFICSCGTQRLSISRQDFKENNLRLDGFYYNKPQLAHFFLYKNGVVFRGGDGFIGSLSDLIKYYYIKDNYKSQYKLPYRWGVFQVHKNKVTIEWWRSGDGLEYPTTKFTGDILNDSTIILDYPAESIERDTFYFYAFSPKPDSTNVFVK